MVKMNVCNLIEAALEEDRCDDDVTTIALIPEGSKVSGNFFAKETGIVAGLDIAGKVFCFDGSDVKFKHLVKDGDQIHPGLRIAEVKGDARTILSRERIALNLIQRLSGIATLTSKYVKLAGKMRILDTRKTTPGLRELEKYAVRMGGGYNHRANLAEMFLIKDNHIATVGSIRKAVKLARGYSDKKIEVETKTIEQVREAIEAKPDRIMLDNMSVDDMKEALRIIRSTKSEIETEASGGIVLENLSEIAKLGLDFASSGAITHSAKALDISLELC